MTRPHLPSPAISRASFPSAALLATAAISLLACGEEAPAGVSSGSAGYAGSASAGSSGAGVAGASGAGTQGGSGGAGGLKEPVAPGCPEASPRAQATVEIVQGGQLGNNASVTAFFPLVSVVAPGRTCVERIEEACRVEICDEPTSPAPICEKERKTPISAGTISVAGSAGTRTLAFDAKAHATGYPSGAGAKVFLGGDKVIVSAAGSVVPAFELMVVAPVVVTFPTLTKALVIQRSKGLSFSWSADAVAPITAEFSSTATLGDPAAVRTTRVSCVFAGSAPIGKIPGTALTDLPLGNVDFQITQVAHAVAAAENWDVRLNVSANTAVFGAVLE